MAVRGGYQLTALPTAPRLDTTITAPQKSTAALSGFMQGWQMGGQMRSAWDERKLRGLESQLAAADTPEARQAILDESGKLRGRLEERDTRRHLATLAVQGQQASLADATRRHELQALEPLIAGGQPIDENTVAGLSNYQRSILPSLQEKERQRQEAARIQLELDQTKLQTAQQSALQSQVQTAMLKLGAGQDVSDMDQSIVAIAQQELEAKRAQAAREQMVTAKPVLMLNAEGDLVPTDMHTIAGQIFVEDANTGRLRPSTKGESEAVRSQQLTILTGAGERVLDTDTPEILAEAVAEIQARKARRDISINLAGAGQQSELVAEPPILPQIRARYQQQPTQPTAQDTQPQADASGGRVVQKYSWDRASDSNVTMPGRAGVRAGPTIERPTPKIEIPPKQMPITEVAVKPAAQRREESLQKASRELTEANKNLEWVQRGLKPDIYPAINNQDGSVSSHKLAYAEVDGTHYVYPTIIQDPSTGALVEMTPDQALDYALQTNTAMAVPSEELAAYYAERGLVKRPPAIPRFF